MPDDDKRRWKGPTGPSVEGRGKRERVNADRASSRKWIERQLHDPYVRKAKAHGYRARAAYKLIELNERFHLIKRGALIADLGAAPGGWAQVALELGARSVVGVDLLPIEPLAGAIFLQGDVADPVIAAAALKALGGRPNLVLSDMAANTTGHRTTDQIRTGELAAIAAEFALDHLAPGGAFVTKAFQGGLEPALLARLKTRFDAVRHAKPPASRKDSSEWYVIAQGFKG